MDVSYRIFPVVPIFVSLFPFSLPLPRFLAFSCFRFPFLFPAILASLTKSKICPVSACLMNYLCFDVQLCVQVVESRLNRLFRLHLVSCPPWLFPASCPAPVSCQMGSSPYWTKFYSVNQCGNIITHKFTHKTRRFR